MDERRPALSDSSLDRALDAVVNVNPSPEFVARVRIRVASEPSGRQCRPGWGILGPITAAAVATVAILVSIAAPPAPIETRDLTVPPTAMPGMAAAATRSQEPVVARSERAENTNRATRGTPAGAMIAMALPLASATPADRPPFPEVLVSRDEVQAFENYVATIQNVPPSPRAERGLSELIELPQIELVSLTVEPLSPIARLQEGERP